MFQRILVPLDGSALAEAILDHVKSLAERFDAEVVLLWVVVPLSARTAGAVMLGEGLAFDPSTLLDAEKREAEDYLARMKAQLQSLRVSGQISEGDPVACILQVAEDIGADLIAMTTHGRTGLAHAVLGSVAEKVVRQARCPVLLVRASARKD